MLSKRVQGIVPFATMALSAKVDEPQRSGIDIVNFSLVGPDFETPVNVIEACKLFA